VDSGAAAVSARFPEPRYLAYLAEHPHTTTAKLARALDVSRQRATRDLERLEAEGHLACHREGGAEGHQWRLAGDAPPPTHVPARVCVRTNAPVRRNGPHRHYARMRMIAEQRRARALEVIRANPRIVATALAKALGWKVREARKRACELIAAGKVSSPVGKDGRRIHRYTAVDEAQAAAK
jgi:predicted ArsR family transcriptional regulator